MQFLAGALVGLLVAVLFLRSKITWRSGLAIAIPTGIVFNLVIGLWAWASSRQDKHAWTNFIEANGKLFILTTTIGFAIFFVSCLRWADQLSGAERITNVK